MAPVVAAEEAEADPAVVAVAVAAAVVDIGYSSSLNRVASAVKAAVAVKEETAAVVRREQARDEVGLVAERLNSLRKVV